MPSEKMNSRKKTRYRNILKKLFDVVLVDEPSNIVVICNGGFENGLTREKILDAFCAFGTIHDVFIPSRQTFSFVQFQSVDSAKAAMEFPGDCELMDRKFYMGFVDRVPAHETNEVFEPPPGLMDFVTADEENEFLAELNMDEDAAQLKNRTVKHFGFEFCYNVNAADSVPIQPIPECFAKLWVRLREKGINFEPDQCTANRYAPGDGIPPHVDTHSAFTDAIVSLSLQSGVVMDWRKNGQVRHVFLPRGSLCVMTGESRYGWTHGIALRKTDVVFNGGLKMLARSVRTSVTFRKTQNVPCFCEFLSLCDTKRDEISEEIAGQFEQVCVHQVYEEIADHFNETRHKSWPNVVKFLETFPKGSLVLDVGCGNGKYLKNDLEISIIGCDRSNELLRICASQNLHTFLADCLCLPVRDASVDGCISIAVFHHLSTKERRRKAVAEVARVLRPGGRALIYVWAKNQERHAKKSTYLKQRKEGKEQALPGKGSAGNVVLPVHKNRTNFLSSDLFVPWQKQSKSSDPDPTYLRYYHVFEDDELREICASVENIVCCDYYYDQGNWCIIFEKLRFADQMGKTGTNYQLIFETFYGIYDTVGPTQAQKHNN